MDKETVGLLVAVASGVATGVSFGAAAAVVVIKREGARLIAAVERIPPPDRGQGLDHH